MNRLFFLTMLVLVVFCGGYSASGSAVDDQHLYGDDQNFYDPVIVEQNLIVGQNLFIEEQNKLQAQFVKIPEGSFIMRAVGARVFLRLLGEEQNVSVEISKSFEIMSTEVTQQQWFYVMGQNPSYYKDCSNHDNVNNICPDHPVERVSWDDVQEFIKKLNDSKGLEGCDGTVRSARGCYRLPTEAEWEYAMRARTSTTYFFGENPLEDYVWYRDTLPSRKDYSYLHQEKTYKVGQKLPNQWGLYDMYGNVAEWVLDVFNETLPGGIDPLNLEKNWSPLISSCVKHVVVRGGSYYSPTKAELSGRYRTCSTSYSEYVGFRLVRTL